MKKIVLLTTIIFGISLRAMHMKWQDFDDYPAFEGKIVTAAIPWECEKYMRYYASHNVLNNKIFVGIDAQTRSEYVGDSIPANVFIGMLWRLVRNEDKKKNALELREKYIDAPSINTALTKLIKNTKIKGSLNEKEFKLVTAELEDLDQSRKKIKRPSS